jgi:hypothetical protein
VCDAVIGRTVWLSAEALRGRGSQLPARHA